MPSSVGLIYESGTWEVDVGRGELRMRGASVPIGGRAFEVLAVLAESAGRLVTKDELMDRVWSGAVVEENSIQVQISAVRRALGDDRDMLRTVSGRGYRLQGDWSRRSEMGGPSEAVLAMNGADIDNLPPAGFELIGRDAELRQLLDLLSAYRVVTLTGPGGIGKTRLALEAGRGLAAHFPNGRCLIELAPLNDASLVPAAAARVLGLEWGGDDIVLARTIGERRLLLILDTCEHVIDAAARFAETILRHCPHTTILATSREILRIDGECVYRVLPLDTPPEGAIDRIDAHGAVQLFVARMKALRSGFVPEAVELEAIAAICRRLDGIPLAIEFAAARAATLGLKLVLDRLDDRFGLLTGGRRTALPRHQTLHATLDWSHDLLDDTERRLFRRLGVFAGGFTVEAAAAIACDVQQPATMVADGVANLVAKSLVILDGTVAADRWRLLDTVRAYALEKLGESGEVDVTRRRHAEFYRDFFGATAAAAAQGPVPDGLSRYFVEIDNARVALDWCFAGGGDACTGAMLTAAYAPIWLRLSLVAECCRRAEQALRSLEHASPPDASLRTRLEVMLAASLLHSVGADDDTAAILDRAFETAARLGDAESQLRALWAMWSYRHNGRHRIGQALAQRFLDVAEKAGAPADILVGYRLIGTGLHYGGDHAAARRYLERVLDRYVAPAGQRHMMWFHHDQRVLARAILARVAWMQGLLDQARVGAEACFDAALAAESRLSQCYVLGEAVCPIMIMAGDFAAAERYIAMLTEMTTRHGITLWQSLAPCLEGALKIERGEHAEGTMMLSAALQTFGTTGLMIRKVDFLGTLAKGLGKSGKHDVALATIDEAIGIADSDGQCWCSPELLRIKGELLLDGPGDSSVSVAEECFLAAVEKARRQDALFWELRSTMSLARLRIARGREGMQDTLARIVARFTEGFETADLRSARSFPAPASQSLE